MTGPGRWNGENRSVLTYPPSPEVQTMSLLGPSHTKRRKSSHPSSSATPWSFSPLTQQRNLDSPKLYTRELSGELDWGSLHDSPTRHPVAPQSSSLPSLHLSPGGPKYRFLEGASARQGISGLALPPDSLPIPSPKIAVHSLSASSAVSTSSHPPAFTTVPRITSSNHPPVGSILSVSDSVESPKLETKNMSSDGSSLAPASDESGQKKSSLPPVVGAVKKLSAGAPHESLDMSLINNPLLIQYLSNPVFKRVFVKELEADLEPLDKTSAPGRSNGSSRGGKRGSATSDGEGGDGSRTPKRRGRKPANKASTSVVRQFTCHHPNCGDSFPTQFSLKRHFKRHTGQRPYKCTWVNAETGKICPMRFAEKSTLKRHIQMHNGNKPYVCNFADCKRRYPRFGLA